MGKFVDLTGKKFGLLTVLKRSDKKGDHIKWVCQCSCENATIVEVIGTNLTRGITKSCGCLRHRGHHQRKTRLYCIWMDMKQRCSNPNCKAYQNYGGRGIQVCDKWRSDFMSFRDWAFANGYDETLEIDRINNDDNYSPDNCRWITHQEQQYNKRTNRLVEYNGVIKPLKKWTEELGLDYHRVNIRLLCGWTVQDAFWGDGVEHFKKHYGNRHNCKPVIQYDLDMKVVNTYNSIGEAAQAIGGTVGAISKCCRGERENYKDFIWRFNNGNEVDCI